MDLFKFHRKTRYNDSYPDCKYDLINCLLLILCINRKSSALIQLFILFFRRMLHSFTHRLILIIMLSLVSFSCGQDDDQREFEQEAFQLPEGITETEGDGDIIKEDPDDWRTSPFYQGLVFVNPAFPNPVSIADKLSIEIEVSGIDAVSGLTVAVLIDNAANAEFRSLYTVSQNPLPPGLTSIPINPVELGRFNSPESARGIHRLIIYDNQQNIISYGDVRVE